MDEDIEALRGQVVARHGTIYRFCKAHGFPRSTASLLFRGRYGGDVTRQIRRVRELLGGTGEAQRLFDAIKAPACARCSVKGPCSRCDDLFRAQADSALAALSQVG